MEYYCPRCGYANSNRSDICCGKCGYCWDEASYKALMGSAPPRNKYASTASTMESRKVQLFIKPVFEMKYDVWFHVFINGKKEGEIGRKDGQNCGMGLYVKPGCVELCFVPKVPEWFGSKKALKVQVELGYVPGKSAYVEYRCSAKNSVSGRIEDEFECLNAKIISAQYTKNI